MSVSIFTNTLLNLIAFIPVDAKINEGHRLTATPSNFALESGAVVTDHVIQNPVEVDIEFLITNQDLPFTRIGGSYGVRAIALFQLFAKMYRDRDLHTIVTRHDIYTNMCLVELPVNHSAPFTGSISGKVKFQQINKARLFNVTVSNSDVNPDVAYQASDASSFGNLVTQTLDTSSEFYDDILGSVGL